MAGAAAQFVSIFCAVSSLSLGLVMTVFSYAKLSREKERLKGSRLGYFRSIRLAIKAILHNEKALARKEDKDGKVEIVELPSGLWRAVFSSAWGLHLVNLEIEAFKFIGNFSGIEPLKHVILKIEDHEGSVLSSGGEFFERVGSPLGLEMDRLTLPITGL